MKKLAVITFLVATSLFGADRRGSLAGQRVWIVEEQNDWNHAVSELVASGDQKHYAISLGTQDGHWLSVREELSIGSYGSYPWRSESFDSVMDAAVRFEALAPQSTIRKLFTESTGKTVIVYKCKTTGPCGI